MYCVAGGHEAPTLKFILHIQMKSRILDVEIKINAARMSVIIYSLVPLNLRYVQKLACLACKSQKKHNVLT